MEEKLTPIEELSYEQAFTELEELVGILESEEHPLEKSIAMFERGQALANHCAALLDKAEVRIEQLSGE